MENISAQVVLGFIFIILAVIALTSHMRRVRMRRARVALIRSVLSHPAGRDLPRVLEDTRHLDRPGFDWTSDKL